MRYFVGFLITVGLLILVVVLLLTGGGEKATPTTGQKPKTTKELAAYADTGAVARLTDSGEINAASQHTTVRITIGREDVTYEQIRGYEGSVVNQRTYVNNQNAYSNFLYAVGRAGFTLGDSDPKLANEKGFCPLGHRFVFELVDGAHEIQRYWATNCGNGAPKTYKGNLGLTLTLFQLQVPDYSDLTSELENF